MGKSYTLVFNSLNNVVTSVVGETFNYDWGQLPNKPYKVTFSFIGSVDTLVNTGASLAVLYIDLNQQCSIIAPGSSTGPLGMKNNYLGCLMFSGTGVNNNLYADIHTNPPIYINGRPTNNNIFVEIHSNALGGMTNYAPTGFEYILTLNLEEC